MQQFNMSGMMYCSAILLLATIVAADLPTLYDYYTSDNVRTGLVAENKRFTLNGRDITIYSASFHYFRVPRTYWHDRLRKIRAAGLNAVETYVPWNLHEPEPGVYEFGQGTSDMQEFLNLESFLVMAQIEDLFVIIRPGPYICSEWEFGGLPSWLLREENIRVRTTDPKFMKHVTRYFNVLLPKLEQYQFTKGGPIIMVQIENEYGASGIKDTNYMESIKKLLLNNNIVELLVTSDAAGSMHSGTVPGALATVNFKSDPSYKLGALYNWQPNMPLMVMEFWTGWFDHWGESHHTWSASEFEQVLDSILSYPASVNFYMFIGGTNYLFMNGANLNPNKLNHNYYQPTTSSYDYNAPITESGDYTEKYNITRKLIQKYNKIQTQLPDPPKLNPPFDYNCVPVLEQLPFQEIQNQAIVRIPNSSLTSMELLPINNLAGQSYGYILYRQTGVNVPANSVLKIGGRVCDTVMVLMDGVLVSNPLTETNDLNNFGYWTISDSTLNLGTNPIENGTLDLIVENWGRNNYGNSDSFVQFKGLWQGQVEINGEVLMNWEIVPLEFRTSWIQGLQNWQTFTNLSTQAATMYKAVLSVTQTRDTFIDMRKWTKGFVAVNGFILGRYALIGPQYTLFLPAPLLHVGDNEIVVFEHFKPGEFVSFVTDPIWD